MNGEFLEGVAFRAWFLVLGVLGVAIVGLGAMPWIGEVTGPSWALWLVVRPLSLVAIVGGLCGSGYSLKLVWEGL